MDNPATFRAISNAVDRYIENSKWWVDSFLVMPDHLHALISFPELSKMEKAIRDWKRYVARQTKVVWQDGFFEHRLPSRQSANEKWHYILNNPVRKGLVGDSTKRLYTIYGKE